MVWIWIIVAIIVIALIVWWLLSRRKAAQSSRGSAPVGRHVAASERGATTAEPGAAGAAAGPGAAGDQAVFDQEASGDAAAHEDTVAQEAPTTTSEAVPADGASAAEVAGAAEGAAVAEGAGGPAPVVHNTGSTGEEQLVASGSPAADAHVADRAAADAEVAAENDDPVVRPAGAPQESAAAAAHHEDTQFADAPVEHPAEGEVGPGSSGARDDQGTPAAAEGEAADLGRPSEAEESEEGGVSASAGQTAGYAVDRADSSAGDAAASGVDPMTERFGVGAVSPQADGSAPAGHPIKGNADSMLFHTPDSPRYDATNPAVWFTDEAAATSAGFAHWDRTKRGSAIPGPAAAVEAASEEAAAAPEAAEAAPEAPEEAAAAPEAAEATPEEAAAAPEAAEAAPEAPEEAAAAPEAAEATPEPRVTASSSSDAETEPSVGEEAVTGGSGEAVAPSEPDPMVEQFGEGAASPRADGGAPSERHTIKGNADSMLFHTPDSPHYEGTEAEVWFTDEEAAKAAGFKHWDHRRR